MGYRCFIISLVLFLYIDLSISVDNDNPVDLLNIDCGSSLSYIDENGISWVGDDKYVQTGESFSVKPENSISHVEDTLRVFTTRKKNCYKIDSVKKGRVFVRAGFNYGNYDNKSLTQRFALQFDGNDWTSVETYLPDTYYYKEVTYTMKSDTISVCLAQTDVDHFPFISSLVVRSLEFTMYNPASIDVAYPLFLRSRSTFGSKNNIIRYPDDPYDRIWSPERYLYKGSNPVSDDSLYSLGSTTSEKPPTAVFKNAITANTTNAYLELFMYFLRGKEIPAYINWYYSESTLLQPNQIRSFRIFKDNVIYSDPIIPEYHKATRNYATYSQVSYKTRFFLVPTIDTTLPPLINAMEVFEIGKNKLTDGTDTRDVAGLASLKSGFSVLQDWSGDPCLPFPHTWDWVQCNNDTMPRVTALLLSSYGLSGLFPDFSSMDALQTIDLHNNSLQGGIPEFLGAFPRLQTLDLHNNSLQGRIPESLGTLPKLLTLNLGMNNLTGTIPTSLSKNKGLIFTVSGNPNLCTSTTSKCKQVSRANSSIKNTKTSLQRLMFAALNLFLIIL